MRSDPIGIPADLDHAEQVILPPPVPAQVKREHCVVWQRYDPTYLRDRPATLAELEEFLRRAREEGAPNDALLFALPMFLRVGWYAPEPHPKPGHLLRLDPPEVLPHLIDGEGDVWVEQAPDAFTLLNNSLTYSFERIEEVWGVQDS